MKQQYLPGLEPTRKPDALPPKTKTVQKLNNGGTVDTSSLNQLIKKTEKEISKRPEDQPGYNYEKDPNLLRRLKYIAKTFDDNDLGDSLDSAIDKEDIELKSWGVILKPCCKGQGHITNTIRKLTPLILNKNDWEKPGTPWFKMQKTILMIQTPRTLKRCC